MSTDIRDELDRSFGTGPAHPPLEQQLAVGRRALRRRRALTTVVAAGVVAIVGASYAVAASAPGQRTGGEVVVQPTSTPTSTPTSRPTSTTAAGDRGWRDWVKVRYVGHELQIRPEVIVHAHLENPIGFEPPATSDALDITFRGVRSWLLAEKTATGVSIAESTPSNGWASFEDWVDDQVTLGHGGDGWPATMRLTAEGRVVPVAGATVLQRTDDPQLGGDFAPAGAVTGAALVSVASETADNGEQAYFVVWRVIRGELDVITTPPRDVVGATWPELLNYARAQYASGEGLR
ncbi:hypothetical protein [Nocardioides sp.]|uniref:hypothetical protein n=1 Tax=Nocardioides sp. TaxID=35761 RepID=UPI002EDA1A6F